MGRDTFNNLSAGKREAFIRVALEEFALHTYNDASISRILRKLGIAKGSFYQYFTDKKALYFYLKDQAEAKKLAQLAEILEQEHADFWELYRQLYTSGLQFELDYPLHSAFLFNFSREKALPEVAGQLESAFNKGIVFFRDILIREQQQGRINPQFDPELMAYIIMQLGSGMGNWLAWRHNIDLTADPAAQAPQPGRAEMLQTVEQLILILQSGMHHDPR